MSVVVFLVSILILPGLPGLATTPRWCLLAAVVPFVWYFHPGRVTWGHVLGALFLAWCALSLVWTFQLQDGLLQLGKFALLGLLFCVGAARKDLKAVFIGAGLGVAVNSALIVGQSFQGWDILPQTVTPAGTFFNKNFAAEYAALVGVGLLGIPRWRWLALAALPAVALCQSRTVWLALGVAAIMLIWQRNKKIAGLLGIVGIAVASYLVSLKSYTLIQRAQSWQDAWDGLTAWGRGIGSFWSTYPEHASRIDALALRPSEAHNDLLQLGYELGPGVLLLVGLLAWAWRGPKRMEHYVLAVFVVEGLASFPLYMPATAMLAAVVLGRLCGDRPVLQHPLAVGRTIPVDLGEGRRSGYGLGLAR